MSSEIQPFSRNPLTPFQETFVLSACPKGARILSARFHRTIQLPCLIWVRLALPDGKEDQLILRINYALNGVEKEAVVLPVLAKLGMPVPTVLAGPVIDPTQPEIGSMLRRLCSTAGLALPAHPAREDSCSGGRRDT